MVKGSCCSFYKLGEDLIAEILCRLPIESLIKYKLLCKLWCRVITGLCVPKMSASAPIVGFLCRSRFVKGGDLEPFVEYFPNHMLSLLYEPIPKTIAHPFSDLLPFKYAAEDFRDCCSGLLLFVDPTVPQFYVCNPATKQCIGIPKHDVQDASQTACLAFDPLEWQHYKIVKFHLRSKLHFDIFSSRTGKWVTHPIPVEPPIHVIFMKRTVYFDGALYCLAYVEDAPHSKYLARFDLHQPKAHLIERPDRDCADYNGFVGVSRGSLYFYNNQNLMLFIWLFDARSRRPDRCTVICERKCLQLAYILKDQIKRCQIRRHDQ